MPSYCLLVPHYNHAEQLLRFLPDLLSSGLPCVVVDDGSNASNLTRLQTELSPNSQVHLFSLAVNRGKGAAVKAGFYFARQLGFTHVIQIDADGQHATDDLPRFIRTSEAKPRTLICGRPQFDSSAPRARRYGRRVTDFWVALETLSFRVKDGLCGYRVYPLDQIEGVLDRYYVGSRMDFDTEILVKAIWSGVAIKFIDTRVIYPPQSVSHFNYLRDNLQLIRLHTRLMLGMLMRFPMILWRSSRGQQW